nr:MAG TPA: hypothetical protein [Caudoviricetes sp.]
MNSVKMPESEAMAAKVTEIESKLSNKIEPILKSYSANIDLNGILGHDEPLLILTINGQNAAKTIGNISILAEHWGEWTLTCMTKNDVSGNSQMYPTFSNGVLNVPQSYGYSYTVIFKF